jgi:hypothetical protein
MEEACEEFFHVCVAVVKTNGICVRDVGDRSGDSLVLDSRYVCGDGVDAILPWFGLVAVVHVAYLG